MDLDVSMVSLAPKAYFYSRETFQGTRAHTYCSKLPNGIDILNHTSIISSRGHVWFVKETFLTLNG